MSDVDDTSGIGGSSEGDLPKSTVHKLVADALAGEMGCAKDAKDLMADFAKEFITLLATASNELSDKTAKKTMNPEHIVEALKTLGFEAYIPACEETIKDNVEVTKVEKQRKSKKNNKANDMTDEQLAAEQERLFAAARARMDAGESAPP